MHKTLTTMAMTVAAAAVVLAGCGRGGAEPRAAEPSTSSTVAEAKAAPLEVFAAPDAKGPSRRLYPPAPGSPLVLLVLGQQSGWLKVSLPTRPNGSTGWVSEQSVSLSHHDYRIVVRLASHRLQVLRGSQVLVDETVATGARATPTPRGHFYTVDLIQPADPAGPYGAFAYVLSAHSDTLTDFAGGDGVVGIHGTDEPAALGKDVSHGCIRLPNAAITTMANQLPLGVPVDIEA